MKEETSGLTHRERKKRNQRSEIIRAARILMNEKGLDVSVQEIADAANISYPTFFNYFQKKNDLYTALYEEEAEDLDAFGTSLMKTSTAHDAILKTAKMWWKDTVRYRILTLRITENFVRDRDAGTAPPEAVLSFFENAFRTGIERGEFRSAISAQKESLCVFGLLYVGLINDADEETIFTKIEEELIYCEDGKYDRTV